MADIDNFLTHRTSDRGAYLNKWKKDGRVNVWLHTECLPIAVWRHTGVPKVVVLEDKQTGEATRRVWIGNWVCHEDEGVLKKQYKVGADGAREAPPQYCGICRLVDHVRRSVLSGRIDWLEPLFRFEADDPKETVVLFAGPMYMTRKAFDQFDSEEKQRARDAGLNIKESWKQGCNAGMQYLFRVVDDQHPESGVQIAFETQLLGDKVKDVISDRRESRGVEEGDPLRNPYCIQWQYRENEVDPKRKYHALAVDKQRLSPAIEALIYGPAPDVSRDVRPYNMVEMRAFLEQHALVKLPWDDIFGRAKVRPAPASSAELANEVGPEPSSRAPVPLRPPIAGPRTPKQPPKRAPYPQDDDERAVECEACGKAMWDDEMRCPRCGAEYVEQGGKVVLKREEKPAARPMRKRGEAAAPADPLAQRGRPPQAPVHGLFTRDPGDDAEAAPGGRGLASAGRQPGQDDEEDDDPIPF